MGELVNIDDYKKGKDMETDYLKFLNHVNKFIKPPTNVKELSSAFYFIMRYLEGTINCFNVVSVLNITDNQQMDELKQHVVRYLNGLLDDLSKL